MRRIFLTLVVLMMIPSLAHAHEKRVVAGQFELIVGFVNEPAFAGEMNGVDLRVGKIVTADPVEGLEKTLTVTVINADGTEERAFPLRTRYKEPGHYAAYFLPAKPGKYVFLIEGKINGVAVKERFESGKKFHDVEDAQSLRFPSK